MDIRSEQPADAGAIHRVTTAAFAEAEHASGQGARIVARLRQRGKLAVSLVAIEDDTLVGHVAFSPVDIDGVDRGWFGLGPVSVDPGWQRRGIGAQLVRAGLDQLRSDGAMGCVVLGDPEYYGRFGFARDDRLHYDGAPPEYFSWLALCADAAPAGEVTYDPAFSD